MLKPIPGPPPKMILGFSNGPAADADVAAFQAVFKKELEAGRTGNYYVMEPKKLTMLMLPKKPGKGATLTVVKPRKKPMVVSVPVQGKRSRLLFLRPGRWASCRWLDGIGWAVHRLRRTAPGRRRIRCRIRHR